jgi:hypothetical protein
MSLVDPKNIGGDQFSKKNFIPPFFSILLPELGRPHYLRRCLDSIHQFADMPVEIIVHDDGSGYEKQRKILDEMNPMISTLILNQGRNTGLAASFNRCKAMATSDYLLGFNVDTYLESSFLKAMKTALDLPYVGMVVPTGPLSEKSPNVHVTMDGTKILLGARGSCHCYGIKADLWDSIGGWNENVQTTSSDVGFYNTISLSAGRFIAGVEGKTYNEMWLHNGSDNPEHISSSEFAQGDNNIPPIFNFDPDAHKRACNSHREDIWRALNTHLQRGDALVPTVFNGAWANKQMEKLIPRTEEKFIDWEFAKKYGHDKWKDRILEDFNIPE